MDIIEKIDESLAEIEKKNMLYFRISFDLGRDIIIDAVNEKAALEYANVRADRRGTIVTELKEISEDEALDVGLDT